MTKWQYRLVYLSDVDALNGNADTLNQHGSFGWEAVAVVQFGVGLRILMKRRVDT